MREPYANTLPKVAAGRTALLARLRSIAARVEALPLESAAEVLVLLEPATALEREAALALELESSVTWPSSALPQRPDLVVDARSGLLRRQCRLLPLQPPGIDVEIRVEHRLALRANETRLRLDPFAIRKRA